MSGHSKWHNIAAKKGKADAARGKVFTKLGRELMIAVKQGGPDPAGNSKSICRLYSKCKHKPEAIKAISIKDVFVDSGTMHEVYKSVYLGIPSVSHYVHFSGNCIPVSCFLNIVNGTSLEEIVV